MHEMIAKLTAALLLVGTCVAEHPGPYEMLTGPLFPIRHPEMGSGDWLAARDFVKGQLRDLGFSFFQQTFTTNITYRGNVQRPVEGINLIAIAKGPSWETDNPDKVMLVGGHYDTNIGVVGVSDGSGMAATIMVARNFKKALDSGMCKQKYSVIFTGLDLQIRKHSLKTDGQSGSDAFVSNFLRGELNERNSRKLHGAILMDSVYNFNDTEGSQVFPRGFSQTFPSADEKIRADGDRGNYIALVGKSSDKMAASMLHTWNDVSDDDDYMMYRYDVSPIPQDTEAMQSVLKQDHVSFWNNKAQDGRVHPLPALLLTDTDIWRGNSGCAPGHCQPEDVVTEDNIKFMKQTVNTVTKILLDNVCTGGSPLTSQVSVITVTLSAILLIYVR